MIKPPRLKKGDVVGVVAPSDAVEKSDVEKSRRIIEGWGLKVKIARHVYARVGDFAAGSPQERMEDLQEMIDDTQVRAVWAASGGYAATEIMPVFSRENITKLRSDPKWFMGYSDVTLMLNALTSFGFVSATCPNISGLYDWDKKSQEAVRAMLFGEAITPPDSWRADVEGVGQGRIVASNLETLILSFGTRYDPIMYGSGDVILALEELDIDKSTLQRQIDTVLNHKRAGRIKGVFIGRLVNISEVSYPEWGRKVTAEGLISARIKRFGVPLAFCYDWGHPEWVYGKFTQIKYYFANRRFIPIPNGVLAKLVVSDKDCRLEYLEEVCQREESKEESKPVNN